MDSVTQFVLGAGLGAAFLGKRYGLRKAALTGGLIGTLPDLDVFWDYGGPLENFVQHRSATHSVLLQTLATPIIAEGIWRVFKKIEGTRIRAYLAVWTILITHSLLDATTIYGTQLLWPLTKDPYGIGSMFIIDPLYTLPLLIVTLWALIKPKWTKAYRNTLAGALCLSTAYLGWSVFAQNLMQEKAAQLFEQRGIQAEQVLVIPLPFSTFAWKAIAIQPDTYTNLYLPLASSEDEPVFYQHDRWPSNLTCAQLTNFPAHTILQSFTKGFYSLTQSEDGRLMQADLRMGMTPNYVFRFELKNGKTSVEGAKSIAERATSNRALEGDFQWLGKMIAGDVTTRPAESPHLLNQNQIFAAQNSQKCAKTG